MNLAKRSYQKELLDANDIPSADIEQNMRELNFINTHLGGHKITVNGLRKLIGKKKQIHVCEIGCGGGDNLVALLNYYDKKNIEIKFTGIDINLSCIKFAKKNILLQNHVEWIANNYKKVRFIEKPDIIFSSLFCHHFTDEELIEQIKWMKENCTTGFFINDLQRHFFAYYSIKILTQLFSKSYLVKNDAPLSVARGFKKIEWKNIFDKAGITSAEIQWQWAFRYLMVYKKNAEQ
jgi:2-polyprenyl-3-methyl-5-hydroxy-6-metoxy-1,4-benzoquinol methylase